MGVTRQEVINILEKQGYKSYPPFNKENVVWCASRRLPKDSPECECNEDKISWHVNVYDFDIPNDPYSREYKSIEVEIVAEKHKQWFNLKCYNIQWNDLEKQLSVAEKCLLNSWIACARS